MNLEKDPDLAMPSSLRGSAVAVGSYAAHDNQRPKIGLSDMPTELIRQIVTKFEPRDKNKALWSLFLTSRRFHTIVEDYIFADLVLIGDKGNKPNDEGSYRRTRQLVHRLTTKPELCRRVKSVKTDSWEVFAIHSQLCNYFDQDHSPAAQLLALLPEIKKLSLHFSKVGISSWTAQGSLDFSLPLPNVVKFGYSTVNFHGFPSLTTLALSFDSRELLSGSFFLHPSLQKVVLNLPRFEGNHRWQCAPYTSPVTELHLLQYSPLGDDISKWWILLESFAELKSLYIRYGWSCKHNPRHFSLIHQGLVKQQDALEVFELWGEERDEPLLRLPPFELHLPNPFVGCVPSFRNFSKLKSLALTEVGLLGMMNLDYLFAKENDPVIIAHLQDMLPPNLEVFTHIPKEWYRDKYLGDDGTWDRVWKQVTDLSTFPNLKMVETATRGEYLTEDVRREI